MCLTGVDYFSTLGYQPGIAFLAAGYLSPVATLVLVLMTLFAAFPVYAKVAEHSPDGQGSISMLERLFPGWRGKVLALILLGFAATDFIITMTLSAADATAHVLENPYTPEWMQHRVGITLVLLAFLGAIFLKGFKEAMGIAVVLVAAYLLLNTIVILTGAFEILRHTELLAQWRANLALSHASGPGMFLAALLLFPKLALGLSGFETGVAVMPQVAGGPYDTPAKPIGRIRNTRKLLLTAALIMSTMLMGSSIVTTVLISPEEFHGPADGRALAFLAHRHLGETFGTLYDLSTILILSFAGASAMAGLLNLVPRYLPRYGMAPEWAKASRPLVLVFIAIAFGVTVLFDADVDAQGGAYATGVLVLMTSAAVSVAIVMAPTRWRWPFLSIAAVFIYTAAMNMVSRPEGIKIASFFIVLTIASSLFSRALRSTELRISGIVLDDEAKEILESDTDRVIRIVAHRPGRNDNLREYDAKERHSREVHHLSPEEQLLFLEINSGDASDFDAPLHVAGVRVGRHKILRAQSPAIPNAIAALLIHINKLTGKLPHAYFGWTEGNPVGYIFRFLFLGEGDVAPITREVLRKNIPDPDRRPFVHVV